MNPQKIDSEIDLYENDYNSGIINKKLKTKFEWINPVTVCIGAFCENEKYVVLASDTMISSELIQFENLTKKIIKLSSQCAVLIAGDGLIVSDIIDEFKKIEQPKLKLDEEEWNVIHPPLDTMLTDIKSAYIKIRKSHLEDSCLIPRGFKGLEDFYAIQNKLNSDIAKTIQREIDNFDFDAELLIAYNDGSTEYMPWHTSHLYHISPPGIVKNMKTIGFHSIGIGALYVIPNFINRNYNKKMSLEETLMIVYESKLMAEKTPGVGLT